MTTQPSWSGRAAFLFATVGSAVGLGSIWKFPYMVGENGGGAFMLLYLAGLAIVVLPLMIAEFVIGRAGQGSAVGSIIRVADRARVSRIWGLLGAWGVAAAFLILSFYSVIGGWTIAFVVDAATGGATAPNGASAGAAFDAFLADPNPMILWHGVFMTLTAVIVLGGISGGLERALTVLMPLMFLILIGLVVFSALHGGMAQALTFLFQPDFSKVTFSVALSAVGLGFFSISVGLGAMITYAAYAGRDIGLGTMAVATIAADTFASILAGLAIFPIVFAHGLDPAGGPGLMFVTLPVGFGQIDGGWMLAFAFFALLLVSALASAISLLEVVVSWAVERFDAPRPATTLAIAVLCFLLGLATVFSFNIWAEFRPFAAFGVLQDKTWFDAIDWITSNLMLPVGGILIAGFLGWTAAGRILDDELGGSGAGIALLRWLLRLVVPAVIGAVLVTGILA
jgi:NSS family neurotransmitter:Na+ symporter